MTEKVAEKAFDFFFKNKTFLEIVVHLAAVLNCRKKRGGKKFKQRNLRRFKTKI
jgi:hypothetical protein